MTEKQKTYIEFIGLSGAGKTTHRNALATGLQKEFSVLTEEIFFKNRGKVHKCLLPIILNFKKTVFLYYFWQKNKNLLANFFGKNYKRNGCFSRSLKRSLFYSFIFSKSNFEYFLSDGYLHLFYYLADQQEKEKYLRLCNTKKDDKIIFIFINTPPEVAYRRKVNRDNKKPNSDELQNYKQVYSKILKIHSLFSEKEGKEINKVIKINGEKPMKENVNFIKKELVRMYETN